MTKGFVIAAPSSGSGKTLVTLGLLARFREMGVNVAGAKCGPDYIDPRFHEAASGRPSVNLDPWAMRPDLIHTLLPRDVNGDGYDDVLWPHQILGSGEQYRQADGLATNPERYVQRRRAFEVGVARDRMAARRQILILTIGPPAATARRSSGGRY